MFNFYFLKFFFILHAFIEQLHRHAINSSMGERQGGTYMGLLLFFVAAEK